MNPSSKPFPPGLTGTAPSISPGSPLAGSSHTWDVKTAYYHATIPIWLDEVAEPEVWAAEFLTPEAREVLSVIGAFVVCFRRPVDEAGLSGVKTLLEGVSQVVKDGCGYAWDGACVAVAMPQSSTPSLERSVDEWGDLCQQFGFEYVDFEAKGRNEYSGLFDPFCVCVIFEECRVLILFLELMGVERLKEALEANDWDGNDDAEGEVNVDDLEAGDDEEEDDGSIGFGIDPAEMKDEMAGMKQAIYGGSAGGDVDLEGEEAGDREIQQMQAMMLKMQAVRGKSLRAFRECVTDCDRYGSRIT